MVLTSGDVDSTLRQCHGTRHVGVGGSPPIFVLGRRSGVIHFLSKRAGTIRKKVWRRASRCAAPLRARCLVMRVWFTAKGIIISLAGRGWPNVGRKSATLAHLWAAAWHESRPGGPTSQNPQLPVFMKRFFAERFGCDGRISCRGNIVMGCETCFFVNTMHFWRNVKQFSSFAVNCIHMYIYILLCKAKRQYLFTLQSQKAVSANFTSQQWLPFGFAVQ